MTSPMLSLNITCFYEACPQIFETLVYAPEHFAVDKQISAWIIISQYKVILLYNLALTANTLILQLP